MDFFEELDNKFNIKDSVKNLSILLQDNQYFYYYKHLSFEEVFENMFFKKWKYSYGYLNLEDYKNNINVASCYYNGECYFYPVDEVSAIKYLQYAYNIVNYMYVNVISDNFFVMKDYFDKFCEIFKNKFNYILLKMNCKAIKHPKEDYYIIVPNDTIIEKCVKNINNFYISFLLFEYSSKLLIGNIVRKREILNQLSHKVEPIIGDYTNKYKSGLGNDIFSSLSSCLNNFNIRHNNLDERKPKCFKPELKKFKDKDFEEIYDVTFDLIINALLLDDFISKKQKIYKKYIDLLKNN